ncbi:MAG: hypothetical protein V4696_06245 [Pseudomonadota bacterium]
MLVNCGTMGLDPATLSLSGYLEALAAYNVDPDKPGTVEASEGLKRFMAAHTIQ